MERKLSRLDISKQLNNVYEYDKEAVVDILTPVLTALSNKKESSGPEIEGLKKDGKMIAEETVKELIGEKAFNELIDKGANPLVILKFVEHNTIKNGKTQAITSAQNRGRDIIVDAVQNIRFYKDNRDGKIKSRLNLTGIYNIGRGAHEFIHSMVHNTAYLHNPGLTDEEIKFIEGKVRAYQEVLNKKSDLSVMDKTQKLKAYQEKLIANILRAQVLKEKYPELFKQLVRLSGGDSDKPYYELALELDEMNHNEILTRLFSDFMTVKYVSEKDTKFDFEIDGPINNHFLAMAERSGVDISGADKGIFAKIVEMGGKVREDGKPGLNDSNNNELLRLAYNLVKGSRTHKTPEAQKNDTLAAEIHKLAQKKTIEAFNNNSKKHNRLAFLQNLYEEMTYVAAEEIANNNGLDVVKLIRTTRFIRTLSSASGGRHTSTVDYQPEGLGRRLDAGENFIFDVVIEVGYHGKDGQFGEEGVYGAANSFAVVRDSENKVRLKEIEIQKKK